MGHVRLPLTAMLAGQMTALTAVMRWYGLGLAQLRNLASDGVFVILIVCISTPDSGPAGAVAGCQPHRLSAAQGRRGGRHHRRRSLRRSGGWDPAAGKPVPLRHCRHRQPSIGAARTAGDRAGHMVPFAPILQQGEQPFSMFVDLQNKYDWVLKPVVGYPSIDRLIEVLEDKVVRPAEAKFNELLTRRTKQLRVENV